MTVEITISRIDVDGFTFTLDESNFVDTIIPSSSKNIPIDIWDRVFFSLIERKCL